jgi:hypothetical protein
VLGEELLGLKIELSTLFGWFCPWFCPILPSIPDLFCPIRCIESSESRLRNRRINQILDNCGMDVAFRPDNAPELEAQADQAVPTHCAGPTFRSGH